MDAAWYGNSKAPVLCIAVAPSEQQRMGLGGLQHQGEHQRGHQVQPDALHPPGSAVSCQPHSSHQPKLGPRAYHWRVLLDWLDADHAEVTHQTPPLQLC